MATDADIARHQRQARKMVKDYLAAGFGEEGQHRQNITDMIADLLLILAEEEWEEAVNLAYIHAYEGLNGYGSAVGLQVHSTWPEERGERSVQQMRAEGLIK